MVRLVWPHMSSSLLPLIFPMHCKEKGGVVVGDTEEGWTKQRGGGRRVSSSPSPPPTPALFSISSLSTLQKEVWSGIGQLTGATGEAEWSDGMRSERRQTSSWKMFAAWPPSGGAQDNDASYPPWPFSANPKTVGDAEVQHRPHDGHGLPTSREVTTCLT